MSAASLGAVGKLVGARAEDNDGSSGADLV